MSLTALAQQTVAVAPEAQSSRARSAASYLERGNGWLRKGEFERAIELNPRDASAWNNRGAARQQLGDFNAALADYAEAIRLNPRLADAWSNRCGARYARGEMDAALGDCEQALKLNPRHATAVRTDNSILVMESLFSYDGILAYAL